jgi:hypothetical protein
MVLVVVVVVVVLWANTTGVAIAQTIPSRVVLIFMIILRCRQLALQSIMQRDCAIEFVSLGVTIASFGAATRAVSTDLRIP